MTETTTPNGFDMATFINTALNRANEDGFNGSNGFFWILFMMMLFGRNGNWGNWGGEGCSCDIQNAMEAAVNKARANELSDKVVLEAVNGNKTAISQLATTLNSDVNTIQTTLNQLAAAIQGVSNQVGLTSQQIINSIQLGNQNIIQQLCDCCCQTKTALATGFGDIKATMIDKANAAVIQNMQQTNELTGVMNAGFALMGNRFTEQATATAKGFQEIKDIMAQSKIDALQEKVTQLQNASDNAAQTAYIQNYVTGLITPLQAAINCINSKVPPTPIPTYPAPQYANGYAYGVIPVNNCNGGCNCGA